MSETAATKRLGRPKRTEAVEPIIEEAAEPKKARTPKAKTALNDSTAKRLDASVKRTSKTKASINTAVSEAAAEVITPKAASSRKVNKGAAAASTKPIGKPSSSAESDNPRTTSVLENVVDAAQPTKQPSLSREATHVVLEATPSTAATKKIPASTQTIPKPPPRTEPVNGQTVPKSPERQHLHASKRRPASTEPDEQLSNGPQTPTSSAPTSKILEALALHHKSTTPQSPPAIPPSSSPPIFPTQVHALGPKFSSTLPLNSPSPTPSSSMPSPQRLPHARPHEPHPLPSGPPNPAQSPLTPQQIETIRSSPAYRSASGRWVRGLVAAPIAIVTSWVLWDRYQNGAGPKKPPGEGDGKGEGEPEGQVPRLLGAGSVIGSGSGGGGRVGGAKPRVIEDYLPGVGFVIREKRLLDA